MMSHMANNFFKLLISMDNGAKLLGANLFGGKTILGRNNKIPMQDIPCYTCGVSTNLILYFQLIVLYYNDVTHKECL